MKTYYEFTVVIFLSLTQWNKMKFSHVSFYKYLLILIKYGCIYRHFTKSGYWLQNICFDFQFGNFFFLEQCIEFGQRMISRQDKTSLVLGSLFFFLKHFAFEKEPAKVRNVRPLTSILHLYYRSFRLVISSLQPANSLFNILFLFVIHAHNVVWVSQWFLS